MNGQATKERTERYEHDCTACVDLGTFELADQSYDLYFCPNEPTVIARFGNDGQEYISGIPFVGQNAAITEAAKRAVERGMIR